MPNIYCHEAGTDANLIDNFLAGYVVNIDGTDVQVIGSGRGEDGWLVIKAYRFDDETGNHTDEVLVFKYDDIYKIEVY